MAVSLPQKAPCTLIGLARDYTTVTHGFVENTERGRMITVLSRGGKLL